MKLTQITQKHILGGISMIIKCGLKIDLIMSEHHNVKFFFMNLIHTAVG